MSSANHERSDGSRFTGDVTKESFVDFMFTGSAVVPLAVCAAGRPDIAIMALLPLLIGACLIASYLEGTPPHVR
jgi:hypothetical protein